MALLLARCVHASCVMGCLCFASLVPLRADELLRIPAFTAYMLPDADSARFSEQRGLTRWVDGEQSVNWYGKFAQAGELTASVELRLPAESQSRLKLSIDDQSF